MNRKMIGNHETWKCADPMAVRQIRWFPYIAPSVVERLQATLSMPLNDRGISDYIRPYAIFYAVSTRGIAFASSSYHNIVWTYIIYIWTRTR
jgi:hypothetical protein